MDFHPMCSQSATHPLGVTDDPSISSKTSLLPKPHFYMKKMRNEKVSLHFFTQLVAEIVFENMAARRFDLISGSTKTCEDSMACILQNRCTSPRAGPIAAAQ
jgi:hypothetical protein